MASLNFSLENLGPIGRASVSLGDLTVLVGPQATGKSLFLQFLTYALDSSPVKETMDRHGLFWGKSVGDLLDLYLGHGMGQVWKPSGRDRSLITLGGQPIDIDVSVPKSAERWRTYYIPAQRSLIFRDGWPHPFSSYSVKDPFVVRHFSEKIRSFLDNPANDMDQIFPIHGKLKEGLRDALDRAIFHGVSVSQERSSGRRELSLSAGRERVSYMSWSTGQREFVPLLLGMYDLIPAGRISVKGTEWVILEEIEAGLHPKGIFSVMSLVLELVQRGYKVVLSTHSSHVLDLLWGIGVIAGLSLPVEERGAALCDILGLPLSNTAIREMVGDITDRDIKVFYFDYGESGKVSSKDISSLDPGDDDYDVAGWGGLSGYSGHVADVVADKVSRWGSHVL